MFRTLTGCMDCLPGTYSQETEGTIEPCDDVCHPQAGGSQSNRPLTNVIVVYI